MAREAQNSYYLAPLPELMSSVTLVSCECFREQEACMGPQRMARIWRDHEELERILEGEQSDGEHRKADSGMTEPG